MSESILAEESIRSDFGRAVMYARLADTLRDMPVSGYGIEFGGGANKVIQAMCPAVQWTERNYPEYDVCDASSWNGGCDVAVLDQVLEHVKRPWEVIRLARASVRQALIVTAPFLVKVHDCENCPHDYWRMTPECLRVLAEEAGFADVHVGSWGNALANYWHCQYWHTETLLKTVPEASWREALKDNDPSAPFMVWAVMRP